MASRPSKPAPAEFQFERPDWTLFRSVSTLAQKAGVPAHRLRRLVLKELVDNALDAGAGVDAGELIGGVYYVEDDGPGIPGGPNDIAHLFSISRPLVSSKLWRLPTRGALGNGLRVVAGAVAASDGRLRVWTRDRHLVLTPRDDGGTDVEAEPAEHPSGTRIEVRFGDALPHDDDALAWAREAMLMTGGEIYGGRASPHWYTADAFYELVRAAGERPVRDLISRLDGCTGAKAGRIAATFKGRSCSSLTRADALVLLAAAKAVARPVTPARLGAIGESNGPYPAYARWSGHLGWGTVDDRAEVPVVVEAWADAERGEDAHLSVFVNRTPITARVSAWQRKKETVLDGCGLYARAETGKADYAIAVNILTPYVPLTSDGKAPDLAALGPAVREAVQRAARKAHRALGAERTPKSERTHKEIVLARLAVGIAKASGDGAYRFNQRQLFYVIRPFVQDETGAALDWDNFQKIVTNYEAEHGDIGGMFRDPRGTLYHPHTGEEIALGTLAVEAYARPPWTFNKVLYIEKGGYFEILKAAGWPERHDCALLTSKGYATRAARDLLDGFVDHDEPVTVFCAHDADPAGTMIYQSLVGETRARGRRLVEVINIGLDPWDVPELGLEVEDVGSSERHRPVARYAADWAEWLQRHRVELNAMTTPEFIAWLDAKLAGHDGKVVPPPDVLRRRLRADVQARLGAVITERVLREAGVDEQVDEALRHIVWPADDELTERVESWLRLEPRDHWVSLVDVVADELTTQRRSGR